MTTTTRRRGCALVRLGSVAVVVSNEFAPPAPAWEDEPSPTAPEPR